MFWMSSEFWCVATEITSSEPSGLFFYTDAILSWWQHFWVWLDRFGPATIIAGISAVLGFVIVSPFMRFVVGLVLAFLLFLITNKEDFPSAIETVLSGDPWEWLLSFYKRLFGRNPLLAALGFVASIALSAYSAYGIFSFVKQRPVFVDMTIFPSDENVNSADEKR